MVGLVKAMVGGALIGLGALASWTVLAKTGNNFLSSLTFSFGLTLLLLYGATLFTGACTKIAEVNLRSRAELLRFARGLLFVLAGNVLGVFLLVLLTNNAGLAEAATLKAHKSVWDLFATGILCNALVCLAVLLYRKTGQILAIVMPIMLFVICGFEHSVANLYYFFGNLTVFEFLGPLLVVIVGNLVGGIGMTLVWKLCYNNVK
jgi:formate/nitrite transporter FocA (FNT family)